MYLVIADPAEWGEGGLLQKTLDANYSYKLATESFDCYELEEFKGVITTGINPLMRIEPQVRHARSSNRNVAMLLIASDCHDIPDNLIEILDDILAGPFSQEDIEDLLKIYSVPRTEMAQAKQLVLEAVAMQQFIGNSPLFLDLLSRTRLVSKTEVPVLLLGETGTGKEMVARAVHYLGPRASKPFIPINCGAIPAQLFESEIFGHTKGAFTGASESTRGLLQEAHGGTLFLDEINSLDLSLQVKLLRALEEKRYRPVGASSYCPCDVRIISASNSDLAGEVEKGLFRADLFYRLNVLSLQLPPLRERKRDALLLSEYFLNGVAARSHRPTMFLSSCAKRKILQYDWPGNVRELKNVIERSIVFSKSNLIKADSLLLSFRQGSPNVIASEQAKTFKESKDAVIREFEKQYLSDILNQSQGNVSHAAERSGMDRRAFQKLLSKHKLNRPQ